MKKMIKSLAFIGSMALGAWAGVIAVIAVSIAWGVWELRKQNGTK